MLREPRSISNSGKATTAVIKQGIATEPDEPEALYPLLRFHTSAHTHEWVSLDEYVGRMPPGQEEIYYILGDDERSVVHSPHLELFHRYHYEVLLLTDPLDSFVLVRLKEYGSKKLANAASAQLPPPTEAASSEPIPLRVDARRPVGRADQAL